MIENESVFYIVKFSKIIASCYWGNARTGNGSRWVGEQGEEGGDRGFSEGKLGKGITFEM